MGFMFKSAINYKLIIFLLLAITLNHVKILIIVSNSKLYHVFKCECSLMTSNTYEGEKYSNSCLWEGSPCLESMSISSCFIIITAT